MPGEAQELFEKKTRSTVERIWDDPATPPAPLPPIGGSLRWNFPRKASPLRFVAPEVLSRAPRAFELPSRPAAPV
jgi:hypothetical protein